MSFILEALKKSEKNRQENTTPTLDSQHDTPPSAPQKRAVWPIVLVAVLVINAGILLWLFGPWHSNDEKPLASSATPADQKTSTAKTAAVQPVAPVTPPVPPSNAPTTSAPAIPAQVMPEPQVAEEPLPAVAADAPVVQTTVSQQRVDEVPLTPPEPAVTTAAPQVPIPAVAPPAPQQAVTPQPARIVQPVQAPQPPARKVLALTQLPGNMQQQLPRLHMSVHAFTGDQNTSLIRLNDRIMRAGSYLDDRYRLEEITSEGAIFSYQGYYFLVPRRGA
nr:general secretion pathway protein GspB [uncultured Desulfuromonas sp.]